MPVAGKLRAVAIASAFAGAIAALSTSTRSAAEDIPLVVSREDPTFDAATARLSVGRDGRIYLASDRFVLSMWPDGSGKRRVSVSPYARMAAANADGVIATAHAHFGHSVEFRDRNMKDLGSVTDFLDSDAAGWSSPSDVEAGESGNFYAIDPNRARIVRIASVDHVVSAYSFAGLGVSPGAKVLQLRVLESLGRFYVMDPDGELRVMRFDGSPLWSMATPVRDHGGWRGGFDVDSDGRVFMLGERDTAVQIVSPSGAPAGRRPLQMGDRSGPVMDLRVLSGAVVIKRSRPDQLFEVYDVATGAFRRVVVPEMEAFRISLASDVWTAGASVALDVRHAPRVGVEDRAPSAEPTPEAFAPALRAWLRPLGDVCFEELPFHDGRIDVPRSAGGLYQLRLSPELRGGDSEYRIDRSVEIVAPHARGSISIATPDNRLYFGEGEPIDLRIIARARRSSDLPARVPVLLERNGRTIAESSATPILGALDLVVPANLTRALAPGHYVVSAWAPGLTVAPQPLEIGEGIEAPSAFSVVQHGDYEASFPTGGDVFDEPERVADGAARARKLGVNMFVDRLGHAGRGVQPLVSQTLVADDLDATLKGDPCSVARDKATFDGPVRSSIAAYGAYGIEERGILLGMDAGLPLGTGYDNRTPAQMEDALAQVTRALLPYPGFRGWSWAANWWVLKPVADASEGAVERATYEAALRRANETGAWDPVLDRVSDRAVGYAVAANERLSAALAKIDPTKVVAMTGPYRALDVIPPITFRGADEIDLHYQAEQIQPPDAAAENVDFYKRPGRRAWGHPEIWNDDGTGAMSASTMLAMAMRGADGTGWSGPEPTYASGPSDPRSAGPGELSVLRAVTELLHEYGPWLTTLGSADRVAIVVSSRMMRIDRWAGTALPEYFGRLYEAYGACLHAHRPATFVFAEDVTPETFAPFQAALVVGQRVELDPSLSEALVAAQGRGVRVLYDETSRRDTVTRFEALGDGFDRIERDPSLWQDDSAYRRVAAYFQAHAVVLEQVLGASVPPAADVDDPQILVTERTSGAGHFLWVLNDVIPDLDPGLAWRTGLLMSTRLPQTVRVKLAERGIVYDVFARNRTTVGRDGVWADLRTMPARLYAVLPRVIDAVEIAVPEVVRGGSAFDWQASVVDDHRLPIASSIPVHVELLDGDGRSVREVFASTRVGGAAAGRWVVPIDVPDGTFSLRVSELLSGKSATASMRVRAAALPVDLVHGSTSRPVIARARESVVGRDEDRSDRAVDQRFGPHLKDVAVARDARTAIFGAMNWDENVYAVDLATGAVRWRDRVGQHFAYAPTATDEGFAVQGFDRTAAEGYFLYQLDGAGAPARRFALYGLPKRATNWAVGTELADDIDHFAVSPSGDWVGSAGDLGIVVWARDGRQLWRADAWKADRPRPALLALDSDTLLTLEGATAVAYDARRGTERWRIKFGADGKLLGGAVGPPASGLVAVRADVDGGRVFIVRDGKWIASIPSAADDVAWSPRGDALSVTSGRQLKWFSASGSLSWSLSGDDLLRHPVVGPDGRIAVGSEIGTLYVLASDGRILLERDEGALVVPAWLPDGDLLIGSWMGDVRRLDGEYRSRWRVHLQPEGSDLRAGLCGRDGTPTVRAEGWGNAAPVVASLEPNLLTQVRASVRPMFGATADAWQNPIGAMTDGTARPPARPWLSWTTIGQIDSGWRGDFALDIDTFRTQIRLRGITFVEDPAHPESWVRDARLQYWDASRRAWRAGPYLLSNAARHTHWLDVPIEAAHFRLVSTGGGSWPVGNLRLAALTFHGDVLGGSHPDVVAKNPVATLFDEREDLAIAGVAGQRASIAYGGAYSGNKAIELSGAGMAAPNYDASFGHSIRDWDFEIAEHPEPGQYRWIQFAWRATSSGTTGMSLLVGRAWPEGGIAFVAGRETWSEGVVASEEVAAQVPHEWRVVRADLWSLYRRPLRVRSMELQTSGGGGEFDQILLGRTEGDLERVPRAPP